MKQSHREAIEKIRENLKPYSFRPERIQELMNERLLNVSTLASIIQLTPAGISKILSGNQPRADTIGKISAALGVKPGYFFDRD